MKQGLSLSVLVLLFASLLCFSKLAASSMEIKEGQEDEDFPEEMESSKSFNELMGVEECVGGGGEECSKRRLISEVHLDYIYSQHHSP